MTKLTFEVKLHEGLGNLEFGQSYDEVLAILGEPSEIEILEDEDEDDGDNLNTALCYFYEQGLTLFLEGEEERYLVSIESDNVNLKLFGKNLFAMNEAEIINLMKL
ncbi:MAG TPA: hypothetical protein VLH16_04695, partial [Bacteroidales bacterium]|nr:hypothetical protein [Bacteroidales bacterium]